MNVIFLGAPGTGKGTQAVRLADMKHWKHISTGDVLRKEMADETLLGKKVKDIVRNGGLVSDDCINDVMKQAIKPGISYIFDGYPRTVPQAQFLDSYLSIINEHIAHVVFFDVPEDTIIKRLSGRRKCSQCGKDYNIYFHPSAKGEYCDVCDAPLSKRADDSEDVIKHRLVTYHKETSPLLDYYKQKNVLRSVDAARDINVVFQEIVSIIDT